MPKTIECSHCGVDVPKCDNKSTAAICWICVSENFQSDIPKKKKEGFPRGWRFMKVFVHSDGSVYHKGIAQPDLKDTLKPTVLVARVTQKKSKTQKAQEKHDNLIKISKLKKELKSESRKTFQKKIQVEINNLQKTI